jgi:ABC-type spermidine/putrescine transport system permease subunit II
MGATPVVNALATLILVGSIALVGFGALLLSRDNKQSQMNDSDAEAVASVIPG